jgi:hypothetical protein
MFLKLFQRNKSEDNLNTTNLCIICFQSCNLHKLNQISNIALRCKCNPLIHQACFDLWLTKSQSCPICRTHLLVNGSHLDSKIKQGLIKFVKSVTFVFHILSLLSMLNVTFLIIFNVYFLFK